MQQTPIELGTRVIDQASHFVGVAVARTTHLSEPNKMLVEGTREILFKIPHAMWADEKQVQPYVEPAIEKAKAQASQIPRIGQAWPGQGGIYVGVCPGQAGGLDYHLIVATEAGEAAGLKWGGDEQNEPGVTSAWDGAANTHALVHSKVDHPAAKWAANLVLEGHQDWYLPARHELRLVYLAAGESFNKSDWYWTSTQYSAGSAWFQGFQDGYQISHCKSSSARCRAVRRLIL